MNVQKGVVAEAYRQILAEFAKHNFVKHGRGYRLMRLLTPGIYGVANIGTATQRGDGTVNVYVGIEIVDITLEKHIAELKGVSFQKYEVSTFGTNLGYLMPEKQWVEWIIGNSDAIPTVTNEIIRNFLSYGWPFLITHHTLDSIYSVIISEHNVGINPYAFKIPVLLLMMGRKDAAARYVKERWEMWKDDDYPAADEYRNFAKNFLSRIEVNPTVIT